MDFFAGKKWALLFTPEQSQCFRVLPGFRLFPWDKKLLLLIFTTQRTSLRMPLTFYRNIQNKCKGALKSWAKRFFFSILCRKPNGLPLFRPCGFPRGSLPSVRGGGEWDTYTPILVVPKVFFPCMKM